MNARMSQKFRNILIVHASLQSIYHLTKTVQVMKGTRIDQ